MKKNKDTSIYCSKVILVPYKKLHVIKYHDWMKSEELQELTASEPLTLKEEYEMQISWEQDEDKCTFIILDKENFLKTREEIDSMVGDVNLFFNEEDDKQCAELEIMIAEVNCRHKGFGKEALLAMVTYGMECLNIKKFTAKIGFENTPSIDLFKKLGFKEASRSEYFKETTYECFVTDDLVTSVRSNLKQYTVKDLMDHQLP